MTISVRYRIGFARALRVGLTCLALAGCGEFAYKQGGDAVALQKAEQNCRSSGDADDQAYRDCMAAGGWTVKSLATTYVAPGAAPPPLEPAAAPLTTGADAMVTPAPLTAGADAVVTPPPSPHAAPAGMIEVASWWQLGGSGAAFDEARRGCITASGGFQPVPGHPKMLPVAVVSCMERLGWRAFVMR